MKKLVVQDTVLTSCLLDLQNFREALAVLQRQVEELDELRVSHYQEILDHEEEVWDFVQGEVKIYLSAFLLLNNVIRQVSLVVRSTLDVIDRVSAKAYAIPVSSGASDAHLRGLQV